MARFVLSSREASRRRVKAAVEGENIPPFLIVGISFILLAVGDEELIKIHIHTNEPWKVLEYCASLGEIYDIVVEDMDRQMHGLKG